MTGERHEALGRLTDDLAAAVAAGESIVPAVWAQRFGVHEADVADCLAALQALDLGLGEEPDDGPKELPPPRLPADYELLGEVGRGGMGVVYRARQRSLDREVAIKVLRPGDLVFGDALRRFRSEAKHLARLRHRHIVSVHDLGENTDGTLWFAMDLIDGTTLADEVGRRRRATPARAVRILRQIASAIAHAHAHGIVHRDLKPQNVLIDQGGDAFVVDFGLARDAAAAGTRTLTGELLGTPAYMSPEQARGDAARIGEPTDVWALGALLYELLTGRSPFGGKPLHETIRAILEDDPQLPRALDASIPAELEAVCLKALSKRPEDRYATALAFAEDLERFADGRGVLARAPGRLPRAMRWLSRRRKAAFAVVAAAGLTVAAVALWLPSLRRDIVVGEAQRLLSAGHAAAAIDSLTPLLPDLAPNSDPRDHVELLLARAHNDVAAQRLSAGEDPSGPASAAVALAGERARNSGVLFVEQRDRYADWMWELLRAETMSTPGAIEAPVATALLTPRVLADLRSPTTARAASAAWLLARARVPVSGLDDDTRLPLLRPLVRAAGRALEQGLHGVATTLPCAWNGAEIDTWWSPAVEDHFAELAVDDTLPPSARAVAFRAFCQFVALPVFPLPQQAGEPLPDFGTIATAAERTVAAWRAAASLPIAERLAARVDLLVEAHTRVGELLPGCEPELPRFVRACTGLDAPADAALAAWWQQQRTTPFVDLLRRAAGLAPDVDPTLIERLDRSAAAHAPLAMVWRQLAWLRLPDGARVPRGTPATTDGGISWRRRCLEAAGIADPRHFVAHVALVRFVDGGMPELLHTTAVSARLGERVGVTFDTTIATIPVLTKRRPWQDERDRQGEWLVRWDLRPIHATAPLGTCLATLDADLAFDSRGVQLRGHGLLRANLPRTDYTGRPDVATRVQLGTAACFDALDVVWNGGDDHLHLQLLVAVHEADEARTLGLDDWRLAGARRFVAEAEAEHPAPEPLDWVLPAWWPLPEAKDALRTLSQRQQPSALRHASLRLAGVPMGPGLWPQPHYRVRQSLHPVHIAIATPNPDVRDEVFASLAELLPANFRPGIATTLLDAAAQRGFVLPPELETTVREVRDSTRGIRGLLQRGPIWLLVVTLLFGYLLWHAHDPQKRANALFALAFLVVFFGLETRVQWHGVVLTPTFVLLAIATALVTAAQRSWPWPRRFAFVLLLVTIAWNALSWWRVVEPPESTMFWIGLLLGITGMPWRTPPKPRRRRAAAA
jgi:hypothetical protein